MRKFFKHPSRGLALGPAIRRWGKPRIPGRYRVCDYVFGSVTGSRTLSRRGAIRTFQHRAGRGF
jgi:hypothetical protein